MNIMVFRWSKSVTLKIINTNRDSLKSADFRDTLRRVLNMNVQLAKMEQKYLGIILKWVYDRQMYDHLKMIVKIVEFLRFL